MKRIKSKGISRRDFLRYCTYLTAAMGMSTSFVPRVAEVFAAPAQRPPVIWLHFAECTGCTEGVLRSMYPWIDELALDLLPIKYHETIMAASHYIEALRLQAKSAKMHAVFGGKNPHLQSLVVGGIT